MTLSPAILGQGLLKSVARQIEDGGFDTRFQPIVDHAPNGEQIIGFEALTRFPGFGSEQAFSTIAAAPEEFQASVDEALAIAAIREAVRAGVGSNTELHINLAPATLARNPARFAEIGADPLCVVPRKRKGPVPRIVYEITEHPSTSTLEALVEARNLLGEARLPVALDDLGAGQANLMLWARLQPDILKIDKAFTQAFRANHRAALNAVLEGVIRLSCDARLGSPRVIAEGVETPEHLRMLESHGVRESQGFYWAYPAGADEGGLAPLDRR